MPRTCWHMANGTVHKVTLGEKKKKYRQMKHRCNVDHCTGGELCPAPGLVLVGRPLCTEMWVQNGKFSFAERAWRQWQGVPRTLRSTRKKALFVLHKKKFPILYEPIKIRNR
ncbi:unnamed protein product [Ixodes persulcatus]